MRVSSSTADTDIHQHDTVDDENPAFAQRVKNSVQLCVYSAQLCVNAQQYLLFFIH